MKKIKYIHTYIRGYAEFKNWTKLKIELLTWKAKLRKYVIILTRKQRFKIKVESHEG